MGHEGQVAEVLAGQRNLKVVNFANTKWPGPATMAALAQLPQLLELDLTYWQNCSAKNLEPLAASRSLQSIKFTMCKGLDLAALRSLDPVPLRELDLYGTDLDADDVKGIAKAWPGCTIKLPQGQAFVVPK